MPTSIAEQIAAKVKTRLQEISVSNGYDTTAAQVVRPKRIETIELKSYSVFIRQGDMTPNTELSCIGNPPAIAWNFPIEIVGVIRQSEKSNVSQDTLKNQFHADILKALMSPADWHNWDGLAINSYCSGVNDYQAEEGEETGFTITLVVMFRHDENNPYSVR